MPAESSFDFNEADALVNEELPPAIPINRGLYLDGIVRKAPAQTFAETKLADIRKFNPTPLVSTHRMRTIDGFF